MPAEDQLSAYLDGELDAHEVAELEARLLADASLRDELEMLREAATQMRNHGALDAPDGFVERVLARVADEPMAANTTWWRRPFGIPVEGLAVAAVALVVVALSVPFPGGQDAARKEAPATPTSYESTDAKPADDDATPANRSAAAGPATIAPTAAPGWADAEAANEAPQAADQKKQAPAEALTKTAAKRSVDPAVKDAPPSPDLVTQAVSSDAAPAPAAAGTAEAPTAAKGTIAAVPGYRYVVSTDDPAVLADLQRLAATYGGRVTDSRGAAVKDTEIDSSTGVTVRLPNERLAEFGDALRGLGIVQEYLADPQLFPGDDVPVRVELQLTSPPMQMEDALMMDEITHAIDAQQEE